MRIVVKGRNLDVDAERERRVEKRFAKVARQVSPLAVLEVELREERNPAIRDSQVAEGTLQLKGVTLRSSSSTDSMVHSINDMSADLARQVKRHREKRRKRRKSRSAKASARARPATP